LLYPDHTIQHAGVVLGVGGLAGHAHQDFPGNASGYQRRLQLAQEVSAVTAACLAISRENWDALGGLDAKELAVNYNDVDLGLRAQAHGLRNLYLPQVRARHHESKSRGRPEGAAFRQWKREWKVMEQRWGSQLGQDPAYSPHCSLEAADFSLALRSGVPLVR
jgi:GT2 family glycosyltransferase